jgi:hypothetical protein
MLSISAPTSVFWKYRIQHSSLQAEPSEALLQIAEAHCEDFLHYELAEVTGAFFGQLRIVIASLLNSI